jgi:broad specificity phosphatase PhoE
MLSHLIPGFRETLRTDIDVGRFQKEASRNTNMNLILVSHGLTLRVFLMRWFKWTVDQFQQLHNFGNAGFLVLERGPGGRCVCALVGTIFAKICWTKVDGELG